MNQLIHTSPTLVLHQLGWGIPHAMWRNHAYAFYLDSITNGNGNTKFSLAWTTHWQRLMNFLLLFLLHSVGETLYVGKNRPRNKLTTDLHVLSRWNISGAIFQFHTPWRPLAWLGTGRALPLEELYTDTYNVELCLVTLSPWKFGSAFHFNIPKTSEGFWSSDV